MVRDECRQNFAEPTTATATARLGHGDETAPRGSLVGRGGHASGVCAGSRSGRLSKRPCHGRRRKRDGRRWARKRHRAPASLFRGVHRSNAAASDASLPGGRRRCRDVASKKQMARATQMPSLGLQLLPPSRSPLCLAAASLRGDVDVPGLRVGAALPSLLEPKKCRVIALHHRPVVRV